MWHDRHIEGHIERHIERHIEGQNFWHYDDQCPPGSGRKNNKTKQFKWVMTQINLVKHVDILKLKADRLRLESVSDGLNLVGCLILLCLLRSKLSQIRILCCKMNRID